MRPIEILVHVSGSSRGSDDARYRAQAKGFLSFEPMESHNLRNTRIYGKDDPVEASRRGELHTPRSLRGDCDWDKHKPQGLGAHQSSTSNSIEQSNFLEQLPSRKQHYDRRGFEVEPDAADSSPSTKGVSGVRKHTRNHVQKASSPPGPLSITKDIARMEFTRVQDGFEKDLSMHATPLRQSAAERGNVDGHFRPWGRYPKESPFKTSSTERPNSTSALELTSIKETPRLLIERTPALPRPRTAPTGATSSQRVQPLRRSQSDSWQTPPSTIPDSQPNVLPYNLPEISSSPCLKRPFQSTSPSPTRPSPPGAKKPRIQIPSSPSAEEAPPDKGILLTTSSTASVPSSQPTLPDHISCSPPLSAPITSPLEIHPPLPKTSNARFTTHLTPSLKLHTASLAARYNRYVKVQSRPLHPLERGHWLVPFSGQDSTFESDLWEFLSDYIPSGRAGWGVWAVREKADTGASTAQLDYTSSQKEEMLKVYCWGEVVAEVWLTMFMGGRRRIKGLGTEWIDAGGEAVVIME